MKGENVKVQRGLVSDENFVKNFGINWMSDEKLASINVC